MSLIATTEPVCRPLTAERWADLEQLFGPERGASSGCWCTWFRLRRKAWEAAGRNGRKALLHEIVDRGAPPGVLAYVDHQPVGWCAVSPRHELELVLHSRIIRPVDERPAHAITCFYMGPRWRGRGLMRPLIRAACDLARDQGARLIEAYPVDAADRMSNSGLYHGVARAFLAEAFIEVARRSATRPILRRTLV